MFDVSSFIQGMALGLGMFVCPGPKDLLVLRHALFRRSAVVLLLVGVGSDALLILLGVAGASAVLVSHPSLQRGALWLGVGLMLWHGLSALWRSVDDSSARPSGLNDNRWGDWTALLLTSFLNPVAWMDTVLVIGTTGSLLPGALQPSYVAGAVGASGIWFLVLIGGARSASRWLTQPKTWRVLDLCAAALMVALAFYVGHGLVGV